MSNDHKWCVEGKQADEEEKVADKSQREWIRGFTDLKHSCTLCYFIDA